MVSCHQRHPSRYWPRPHCLPTVIIFKHSATELGASSLLYTLIFVTKNILFFFFSHCTLLSDTSTFKPSCITTVNLKKILQMYENALVSTLSYLVITIYSSIMQERGVTDCRNTIDAKNLKLGWGSWSFGVVVNDLDC